MASEPIEWAMEKARELHARCELCAPIHTWDCDDCMAQAFDSARTDADAAGYERGVREEREWIDAVVDAIEADGCDAAALVIALRLHAGGQDPYDARGAQPKHEQAAEES